MKKILKKIIPGCLHDCYRTIKRTLKRNIGFLILGFYADNSLLIYDIFIKKKSNKFLLCRPRGGLNDTLNQLEASCRYSLKYRRKLYIDTSRSGLWDSFENYFILPKYIQSGKIDDIQYPASVYPACLQNDIYNYEAEWVAAKQGWKIKNGVSFLHLVLQKNHPEQYVVYESGGGGEDSFIFLKRIKLKENIRSHIVSKIRNIGNYAAVHIRNTDYQTDYMQYLDMICKNLKHDKIIICTDDYTVQQYGKYLFGDKLVLLTELPDIKKPLHDEDASIDRYKINVDTITDLFVLACSDKLYITKVKQNIFSGFGSLAMNLHKNKKVVKKLLEGR